jgi:hypothetical protein
MEAQLARIEELYPKHIKMLGCYMYAFGSDEPLPVTLMETQCKTGLRWLREGRIAGMIFLANTVADLGFESVEWTRQWIEDIGENPL